MPTFPQRFYISNLRKFVFKEGIWYDVIILWKKNKGKMKGKKLDRELQKIKQSKREIEKLIFFMGWLTKKFKEQNLPPPVLVGGSALEIYTFGYYTSGDIDLVSERKDKIKEILLQTGLFKEEGRFFISEELELFIEVPDSSLAGSKEKIRVIKIPEEDLEFYIIGLEDLTVDRLCACLYWKSESDCLQAKYLLSKFKTEIDWKYLKEKAQSEGVKDLLEKFTGEIEDEGNNAEA